VLIDVPASSCLYIIKAFCVLDSAFGMLLVLLLLLFQYRFNWVLLGDDAFANEQESDIINIFSGLLHSAVLLNS
jgi:hypothetical protein